VPNISNTPVPGHKVAADLPRLIRRAVVGDHDFDVLVRLADEGRQRGRKIASAVVNGNSDAHSRLRRRPSQTAARAGLKFREVNVHVLSKLPDASGQAIECLASRAPPSATAQLEAAVQVPSRRPPTAARLSDYPSVERPGGSRGTEGPESATGRSHASRQYG
jgi:hypothetical protein